jgi:hypothetical protein
MLCCFLMLPISRIKSLPVCACACAALFMAIAVAFGGWRLSSPFQVGGASCNEPRFTFGVLFRCFFVAAACVLFSQPVSAFV